MVFFTCNACGQAVKKNQVEKHYTTKCRNCTVLSCIDCGKEFCGDEYQQHTKCVTEDEKYGGKDFKPKPSSKKGETRQLNWIENIKNHIANSNVPPKLSSLLNNLLKYDNIPRKQKQFKNFLANSVRVRETYLADEAWEIFMKANQLDDSSKANDNKKEAEIDSKPNDNKAPDGNPTLASTCSADLVKHKKKKKGKNEETEEAEEVENQEAVKKHKKKRKHKEAVDEDEGIVNCEKNEEMGNDDTIKKSKKLKKRNKEKHEEQELLVTNDSVKNDIVNGHTTKKHKKKRKHDVDEPSEEADDTKDVNENVADVDGSAHKECGAETVDDTNNTHKKKKKSKKHKNHDGDDIATNVSNGDECTTTEEPKSKHKTKHKLSDNHVLNVNVTEEIPEDTLGHSEENVHKKKKKKCK